MKLPTNAALADIARTNQQVNLISEGRVSAVFNATAAPSSGTYSPGDFVRNSAPSETGSAGSKYVVLGWVYTAAGFKDCRVLTGG